MVRMARSCGRASADSRPGRRERETLITCLLLFSAACWVTLVWAEGSRAWVQETRRVILLTLPLDPAVGLQ